MIVKISDPLHRRELIIPDVTSTNLQLYREIAKKKHSINMCLVIEYSG